MLAALAVLVFLRRLWFGSAAVAVRKFGVGGVSGVSGLGSYGASLIILRPRVGSYQAVLVLLRRYWFLNGALVLERRWFSLGGVGSHEAASVLIRRC